jgi:formamidopyrimidine-DNA glycosylase
MPELPEVETVRRGLSPVLEGRRLARVTVHRGDLRRPLPIGFAEALEGRRVTGLARRAKYLLLHLDDGQTVIAHLGMSGRMFVTAPGDHKVAKHDHLLFETDDGVLVVFNDPRRFGLMDLASTDALDDHPLLAKLGPDPLGNRFSGPILSEAIEQRRSPIKALLLDQAVVAGLGNIYVCESLFRAGISPRRLGINIGAARAEALVEVIRAVLGEAIEAGGSSLRDYVQASGELGYFQHNFRVYGREGDLCPSGAAGHRVRRIAQSGRSTFFCPRCQR